MSTSIRKQYVRNARSRGWNLETDHQEWYWHDNRNAKPEARVTMGAKDAEPGAIRYVNVYFDFDGNLIPEQASNVKLVLTGETSVSRNLWVVNDDITREIAQDEEFQKTLMCGFDNGDWEEFESEEFGTQKKIEVNINRNQTSFCVSYQPYGSTWSGEYTSYMYTENFEYTVGSTTHKREGTYIEYEVTDCNISNIECTQNSIDSPLVFTWDSEFQTSATVQIYQGTTLKATKSVTTAKTCTFATGLITQSGDYTVKITGCDGVTEQTTVSLTKHVPTVYGLYSSVPAIGNPDVVGISWVSTNQTSYSCTVGNTVYTGTTATSFTIPFNDLNNGTNNVSLSVKYTAPWGEVRQATDTDSFVIHCDLTNLACTQNDIDSGLTFAWDSEHQKSVVVNIYKDNVLKATKSVTTAKTCTFPVGAIRSDGTHKVTFTSDDGVTVQDTFSFTKHTPTISSLEPDGISKDSRETITVAWVSTNQTSYSCTIGSSTYTGTTNKSITLPTNTLTSGTTTINLIVKYTTAWGEVRQTTATSTFTVYGPPTQPTITSASIFDTSTPTFAWIGTGQTAYKLTVKQGLAVIFTTGEVASINKYYACTEVLENNNEYQLYVQIKNKYNIWSTVATQNITISFEIPPQPTLAVFRGENAIVLNLTNDTEITDYKYTEIYRKDSISDDFTRIALELPENGAYYDYFVAHGMQYEYFARNYNQSGGYNNSDSCVIVANVEGYGLYNIEDSANKLVFVNNVNISDDYKRDVELFEMASSKAPYSERGVSDYLSCKVTYKTSKLSEFYELQKLDKNSKVLMYKDRQGRKMACNITSSISRSIDDFGFITIGFTLTEVQFKECDYIVGDNDGRVLLIWNGEWKFDGTEVFEVENNANN